MAGKVKLIELNPDMTFTEKKKKTESNNVVESKHNSPSFVLGRSVFKEIIPRWKRVLLLKKPRNILLYLSGANSCFDIDPKGELESHKNHLWSKTEKEKFINKLVAKLKGEQRPMTNLQFIVLAGLLVFILVMQFLVLRGLPIAI